MAGIKNKDQRQIDFLSYYLNPKSETWNNALASAIKAGYSEKYSRQIVSRGNEWVLDGVRQRERMLVKAERNLDEFLDMPTTNEIIGKMGEKIVYDDPKLKKIKADVSTFTAETLGKKYYSKRGALEDDDGKNILEPLADAMRKLSEKK